MPESLSLFILFTVGIAAGFLNVVAGGGSTLTLPVLIFLGLDAAVANGTNRIAILLQNAAAVYSFKKERYHQFDFSLRMSLLTLPGAIAGAVIALTVSDSLFQKILGVIMIGIVVSMFIPERRLETGHRPGRPLSIGAALVLTGIGFYGGFIQVGVGFILMAALKYLFRFDLVHVNMHKVFIVMMYTIPALAVFIVSGKIAWWAGLSLAAGHSLGGWWAAKLSIRKGESFIRIFLGAAILVMSLKLFDIF